jgi:hypothetical protein
MPTIPVLPLKVILLAALIRHHRSMIETVNGQLEKMGLQRLHARTNSGVAPKVLALLIVLTSVL